MTRQIKFRAWDKQGKIMLRHHEINFDWLQEGNFTNFFPMQFTGLLDKNGKECYEGDLVRYEVSQAGIFTGEVIFSELSMFGIKPTSEDLSVMPLWKAVPFEVIGNIYEN